MAALQQVVEGLHRLGGEDGIDGAADEGRLAAGVEHLGERAVGQHNAAACIERGDAVGDGLQHGFQFAAACFERGVGGRELEGGTLDGVTAVLQLAGHAVEAAHQIAELFGGALRDAVGVVSGGDGLHGVGQRLHGLGHLLGEVEREPTAGEERQRGHQQQEHHVEIAHLAAASVDAPVEVGGVVQAGHGGRDPVRHGQADDHGPALLQGGGAEGEVLIAEREDGLVAALREGEDGRVGRASDGDDRRRAYGR